jgi:predicted metal-dependent hydrolase
MFKDNRNYGDNWWVDWRDYVTGGMSYLERDFRRYSDAKEKRDDARDRYKVASKARRESIANARSLVTEAGFGAEAEQLTDEDFVKWLEANLEIIKDALQKGEELKESIDTREDRLKRLIKANDRQKVLNKRDNKIANITDQTAEREAKEHENAEKQREKKEARREREDLKKQVLAYQNSHKNGQNGGYTEADIAVFRKLLDSLNKSGKSNNNFNVQMTAAFNALSDKIGVFSERTDNLTNQVKKTTQQLRRK